MVFGGGTADDRDQLEELETKSSRYSRSLDSGKNKKLVRHAIRKEGAGRSDEPRAVALMVGRGDAQQISLYRKKDVMKMWVRVRNRGNQGIWPDAQKNQAQETQGVSKEKNHLATKTL